MTVEQILGCRVEELEAMSDKELEQHFAPYFNVTRPDLAKKLDSSIKSRTPVQDERTRRAQAILDSFGFDVKL